MAAELKPGEDRRPGDDRPWLAAYPPGVPAEIDPASAGTLVDIFDESVRRYPERPALESFGKRMSYRELAGNAAAVGSWLAAAGIAKGDRIAIMLPNVMAFPAVLFGVLMSGATVVNVNPLYTPRELAGQLRDSGARTIFVLENFAATVQAVLGEVGLDRIVVVSPGDLLGFKGAIVNLVSRYVKKAVPAYDLPGALAFADVVRAGRGAPRVPVAVDLDDVAFLQYTGGTTGVAKGATLTHRNVAANVLQCQTWMSPTLGDKQHVMVTALPLYHIFALTCCCMVMIRIGSCQLLIANPRDIPGFVKTLRSRPFTCISGVNTLYSALTRAEGIGEVDFSNLSVSVAGGMATQAAVAQAWKAMTGSPIVEGYGLSETSPVITINRLDIEAFSGHCGYPMPSTEISLRVDGEPVAPGQPGELCVRGPQVMRGYWNRPEETANAMTPDGFFRTGDLAVLLLDGAHRIVDRMKDLGLVYGLNVYPHEVEDVIATCPGVLEVAVIGLPDERSGEAVAAYVVTSKPDLTEQDVKAWCRERLAAYKVPHRVVFRDALPKTNVGKVLRRALREEELSRAA